MGRCVNKVTTHPLAKLIATPPLLYLNTPYQGGRCVTYNLQGEYMEDLQQVHP